MVRFHCGICGASYNQWEGHECKGMANAVNNVANKPADMANNPEHVANTYKYRDADKRRAYMREYMRKRRTNA